MKRRLNAVCWLLVGFNLAVMCLAIGFAPPSNLPVPEGYDPINVILISRKWGQFYWIMTASLILSVTIYAFIARWVSEGEWDKEERQDDSSPLFRAIDERNIYDLEAAIKSGADVNKPNEFARTPLMLAARGIYTRDRYVPGGWIQGVQRLLELGADVHAIARQAKYRVASSEWLEPEKQREFRELQCMGDITAMALAENVEIVDLLLAAGADLGQINHEMRSRYFGFKYEGEIECEREEYEQGKLVREGTTNPEKMEVPFWDAMVRSGANPFRVSKDFGDEHSPQLTRTWSFVRMGYSITPLPDGRVISIGGWEACLHNDVIVLYDKGRFEIYGYPHSAFLPIADHTATLVGDDIIVIGGYGENQDSEFDSTPVYCLNTKTLAIERLEISGQNPGLIFSHKAILFSSNGQAGEIHLYGGSIVPANSGKAQNEAISNEATFVLDLASLQWRRADNIQR